MSSAKVITLTARPLQVSHLCFEVDGTLAESDTQLGKPATAFDFDAFYASLRAAPTAAGDPSLLRFDSSHIDATVKGGILAKLRAEPRRLALDKAIKARQNAYIAKYGHVPAIVAQTVNFYSSSNVKSKWNRLHTLSNIAQDQADSLKAAYTNDGRLSVVKSTISALASDTVSSEGSTSIGQNNQDDMVVDTGNVGKLLPPDPEGKPLTIQVLGAVPGSFGMQDGTSRQDTTSRGSAFQQQTILNTDYGYRMPYLESQAQNERAQISLNDQLYAEFLKTVSLPKLAAVLNNELHSLDLDVNRLQVAYQNTILLSPINGTVTGLYKNPGDCVKAGEPVVRIEDNSTVLLQATLVFRGLISIGATVTVKTTLFDGVGTSTLTGNVVSARGNRNGDDQWDVVVNCNNIDGSGNPILPLGYTFDFDNTTVDIT